VDGSGGSYWAMAMALGEDGLTASQIIPGEGTVANLSSKCVKKAVNSNLTHAAGRAAERGVFNTSADAADALRNLSKSITQNGFPAGTLLDTANADRVLVPIGNNGMAVYQVGANGTAKLKTVLTAH
jgi:hypothetical protein